MIPLAKQLYSSMMAVSYYCREEDGPEILYNTMRNIAIDSWPEWQKSQDSVLQFVKHYLMQQDFIEHKCWDQDMMTASALMHLDDICHFIIEKLS